jgi:UDP-N-acetylglucosamine 4,6-dehydratase/5-epimerase
VAEWVYKTILVTGGTGTFSRAMTRYLLDAYPDITIRLLSRDEFKQQRMHQEFFDARLRFLIGDVRDVERLKLACHGVDLVIHAAALKHIDRGEQEPLEFIKTNVRGTENVIAACQATGVQQAIFLSTDKSCMPINVYGSTKALAERLWIQANHYKPHGTRFAAVRYGNILGSRGSVVEVWRNMLAKGQQICLTHPEMTRFWMAPQEAVRLVHWTAIHGLRGGVAVPHLPAFLMKDLAGAMLRPLDTYVISGIRPGEKLAEQLMTDDEQQRAYFYASSERVPVFYVIPPMVQHWGGNDERSLWQKAPNETVYGRCEHDVARQVTYRSDVWPWKLTVDDLAQRLKDV